MKTAEEVFKDLKEKIKDNKKRKDDLSFASWGYECGVLLSTEEAIIIVDREAKYKELYEAQKELIIERDKPFANKYHGRAGELINKITALEQELGLKE